MPVDVKQYTNLIQTISFLLKCYKPRDRKAVSPAGNDEDDGIMLLTLSINMFSVPFGNLKTMAKPWFHNFQTEN